MRRTSSIPANPSWRYRLLVPTFPELFFAAILLAAFGRISSWEALLFDGDTGWHIRTGELILRSGAVPRHDPFSFSRPGEPWFAWEWLSDVIFALWHAEGGVQTVAAFSAVVLCAAGTLLLCWLLRRGVGLWIGLAVTLAAVSASTVHYLARPHIFLYFCFPAAYGYWMKTGAALPP